MGQDFVAYLPPEIVMDILSRLRFRSIMRFRCVCKSWLSLTEADEFIKFYLQKSSFPGGLALFQDRTSSKPLKLLEFDEGNDSAYPCGVVLRIDLPTPHHDLIIHSSVNGLLFLFNRNNKGPHFICNPITRDYIKLPPQKEAAALENYGFGASKLTGQYKVVRMLSKGFGHPVECEVYTVGTGSWRTIAVNVPLSWYAWNSKGFFFNGNLRWLAYNLTCSRIICFDLETERFSTFFTPGCYTRSSLYALGDCLYFCGVSFDVFVIWLMNEHGDDTSWTRERVIKMRHRDVKPDASVVPIKIFKDGDILFRYHYSPQLYCYSSKTKTIREITYLTYSTVVSYTPSFSTLKAFAMENVSSF